MIAEDAPVREPCQRVLHACAAVTQALLGRSLGFAAPGRQDARSESTA